MPRVIILGDLSELGIAYPQNNADPEQIKNSLADTEGNFDHALAKYSAHYPAILERHLHPPSGKYRKEYLSHLQSEVQEAELEQYVG